MPRYPKAGITKLSELEIDVDKDWAAKKIENLGAPDSGDDAPRDDTIDNKITTHKADASAHHTKTTDAGDITSGRFGKNRLEWTADKLLKGAGAGADPVEIDVPSSTKHFFVPATNGTERYTLGSHTGYRIDSATDEAYIEFTVPRDFSSLSEAFVVWISLTSGTHRFNEYSNYGKFAEPYNNHSESDLDAETTGHTANDIIGRSISNILSALAPYDYVGIRFVGDEVNTPNGLILGVYLLYY